MMFKKVLSISGKKLLKAIKNVSKTRMAKKLEERSEKEAQRLKLKEELLEKQRLYAQQQKEIEELQEQQYILQQNALNWCSQSDVCGDQRLAIVSCDEPTFVTEDEFLANYINEQYLAENGYEYYNYYEESCQYCCCCQCDERDENQRNENLENEMMH